MRILVISPFFYPHIGGSQRYMEELYAFMLRKHPDMKVDVLTYNTTQSAKKESYKRMTIYRIGCLSLLPGQFVLPNPFDLLSTLFKLAQYPYTVVHTNTRFFESTWWAWMYARFIGAKSILTDHVATHPTHPNQWVRAIAHGIDQTIAAWALQRYDLVTATNEKTKEFLLQLQRKDTVLSYGGVDTKFYAPATRRKKHIQGVRHTFTKRDTVITFAGRLIRTKGVEIFLQSILDAKKKLPRNTHVILAGSGPMEAYIKKQIHSSNNAAHIHLIGPQNQQNMKALLQATDIFVHPSYHAEGFPNALLEAGSAGCFVIATDNAGTDEIISHNTSGYIIPQQDPQSLRHAILWAIAHPRERRSMAAQLRAFISAHFSWKDKSEEMFTITRQLFLRSPSLSLQTT